MKPLQAGDRLDHYSLDEQIASGGMATIFRATDLRTRQVVAIKAPHPDVECDPALFTRFQREAEIGRSMDHPAVLRVLPAEKSRRGVVHRDLKPENIILGEGDRIKLIDFGIAGKTGSTRLTFGKFSQIMGTPDYVAPEQVKGKRGDLRTDIYGLGVILYEMVTGQTPFEGETPLIVLNSRLQNDPIPPRKRTAELSPALEQVILRALERDARHRYASATEFASDLLAPPPTINRMRSIEPARRRLLFYSSLAGIPLLIFGLLLYVAGHQ